MGFRPNPATLHPLPDRPLHSNPVCMVDPHPLHPRTPPLPYRPFYDNPIQFEWWRNLEYLDRISIIQEIGIKYLMANCCGFECHESVHVSHIRIHEQMCYTCVQLYAYVTHCCVCVQLYAYVTLGNVNVFRFRATVRICNTWQR